MKPGEQIQKQAKPPSRKSGISKTASMALGMLRFSVRATRLVFFSRFSLIPVLILTAIVPFSAFEAHILNVTATIIQIDPPIISPPGGQYEGPVDIMIDDGDSDATYIFYTITPGTDASLAVDPQCGIFPGGPKPIGPITLNDDSVVKAIACDGPTGGAHYSAITTEIYDLTIKGKIQGRKYHDLDQGGTLTGGDTQIEGWNVALLSGTSTVFSTVTDSSGYYAFNDLDPGTYTVIEEDRAGWRHTSASSSSVVIVGGETHTVNFFNFDTGFACVPQPVNFTANLAVQAAGSSTIEGNDDVVITNNVDIFGDVRSNDEIEKDNSNGPRTIHGNASTTNTIDPVITVTGVKATGTPAVALPDIMIPIWKARAAEGGTVNGNFNFPNGTGMTMGPTEILGSVTLGSSNNLNVKGPIYIHGDFTIGSNSTINQDPAFGNQFATIIVDGKIHIDSNISFNGASSTGTFLLISTRAPIAGDDAAIETNSNNSDLGDVVLYASDGDIHIRSNRTVLALFAAHGTGADSDDNAAIRIDSNVDVNYRALPNAISCGPRQPFESTSHVLINEFMPNPAGGDTGAAGLPLDGEWVEIFNPTSAAVDLAGFVLYDGINTHELAIDSGNTNTGGTVIPSLGYLVVYREGDGDFELNNSGGDTVRLFSAAIGSGGILIDSHLYTRDAPENKSFARVPDGASNWVDPDATPGGVNDFFFEILPGESVSFDPPDNPPLVIEPPRIEVPKEEPAPSTENIGTNNDVTAGASSSDSSLDRSVCVEPEFAEVQSSSTMENASGTEEILATDAVEANSTSSDDNAANSDDGTQNDTPNAACADSTGANASSTTDGAVDDSNAGASGVDIQNSSSTDATGAASSSVDGAAVPDPQTGDDAQSGSKTPSADGGDGSADANINPPAEGAAATTPTE